MNDPDNTAPRRGTIRERLARFVEPSPRTLRATESRSTPTRPSEPGGFRRLPKRVNHHEMRGTQETRAMRSPIDQPNADVRYACDGLGDI